MCITSCCQENLKLKKVNHYSLHQLLTYETRNDLNVNIKKLKKMDYANISNYLSPQKSKYVLAKKFMLEVIFPFWLYSERSDVRQRARTITPVYHVYRKKRKKTEKATKKKKNNEKKGSLDLHIHPQ